LLRVAEKGRAGEVYNIGGNSEAELTNKEVTRMILEILGKPADLVERVGDRPAHDRRYAVDTTKIKNELGWTPSTPFKEGLARTVAWYQENQEWWREIKSGAYLSYYEKNYASR
jgi:dTDP-glucose 4,6-dehydratase